MISRRAEQGAARPRPHGYRWPVTEPRRRTGTRGRRRDDHTGDDFERDHAVAPAAHGADGLALLAGLAIALAGCTVSNPNGEGAAVVETSAQGAAPAGAGGGETAGDVPATGAPGTRQDPVPAGTTVKIGDWQVRFAATNPNANQQIAAENQFNEPPAAGRQFVLVPVEVAYTGAESGTAWTDLSIKFLGAGGNTFGGGSQDDYCGVIPNALTDLGEMFPDAKGSGNECVSVPADQIEGGAWIVEESFALDDNRVFFALS